MGDVAAIIRLVHFEWVAAGRIIHPDEGGGLEDDLSFWSEVDERLANIAQPVEG